MKLFKDHNAAIEFGQDLNLSEQENFFKNFNNSMESWVQVHPSETSTLKSSPKPIRLNESENLNSEIIESNNQSDSAPTFGNAASVDSFGKSAVEISNRKKGLNLSAEDPQIDSYNLLNNKKAQASPKK